MKNDKSIVDFKVIENDLANKRKIIYMEAKMPMMSNRTALLDFKMDDQIDGGNIVFSCTQSIERDDYPETKKKVRMFMLNASLARMEGDYLC